MYDTMENTRFFCLTLFAGGAASAGEGTGSASGENTGASAATGAGKGGTDTDATEVSPHTKPSGLDDQKARREAFERLIGTDYKDIYAEKTQKLIDRRFKQTKELEEQNRQIQPILERLRQKYGAEDPQALLAAMDKDAAAHEGEARDRRQRMEQAEQMKRMQRQALASRQAQAQRQRQVQARTVYADWTRQADDMKQIYPSFDLRTECRNTEFLNLLRGGATVKTAYEATHQQDILGGAMAYTAQKTRQAVMNNIRMRGMRPVENGLSSTAAAVAKTDVNKMTKAEREAIERRVLQGERIVL